jgi:hypothetical protein
VNNLMKTKTEIIPPANFEEDFFPGIDGFKITDVTYKITLELDYEDAVRLDQIISRAAIGCDETDRPGAQNLANHYYTIARAFKIDQLIDKGNLRFGHGFYQERNHQT